MRDLKECQVEVFRRSEKRIKARRQRRACILMACIPFALCITLFSAFILPAMLPAKSTAPGTAESIMDNVNGSLISSIAEIEVSGKGISLSYTEPSQVLMIFDQLNACRVSQPENAADESEEMKYGKDGSVFFEEAVSDSENAGVCITLILHEGGKTEYYLSGNTLENRTENQTYTLSPKQAKDLNALLGLPNS